jgi:hypothetical protein
MPVGERRKPIDIEDRRKVSNFCSIFISCDLDLCPTNLIINRLPLLIIRHMCTKDLILFLFPHDIVRTKCWIEMKLGTHMPDGERRKPIDIEVCRTKVKVTTSKHVDGQCDLDL